MVCVLLGHHSLPISIFAEVTPLLNLHLGSCDWDLFKIKDVFLSERALGCGLQTDESNLSCNCIVPNVMCINRLFTVGWAKHLR